MSQSLTTNRHHAGQPSLDELMARFLAARKSGTTGDAVEFGDVEPHEVTGGFRPTTTTAWDEAREAFRLFGVEPEKLAAPPPDWTTFASLALPVASVPLAAGLFPQRVRSIPTVSGPHAATDQVSGLSGLRDWVRKALKSNSPTALLLAAGVAAGLGDWDDAEAALAAAEPLCEGQWRAVWANQRAAVRWLRGETTEAAAIWATIDNSLPVAFNRGMAELFTRKPGHGSRSLQEAANGLKNDTGWSHLAGLYVSLARAQG